MPIDPYTPCPGGTGKKIKFCCSDLVTELDKIQRMLEGEQRAACLEHIDSLEGKFPERACLLSIKAMLEAQLGQEAKAEATLATFREKYPDNPVALAEQATISAGKTGGVVGGQPLQDALERCVQEIPPQVYDAIGLVGEALMAEHWFWPAARTWCCKSACRAARTSARCKLLGRINSSPSVPLLAKQDIALAAARRRAVEEQLQRGARAGHARLVASGGGESDRAGRQGRRLAGHLAQHRRAAHLAGREPLGHRGLAKIRRPRHSARRRRRGRGARATARSRRRRPSRRAVDSPTTINDVEALQARLAANPRSSRMPIDLARMGSEDEPPPKGAFWLLDRAVPASGDDLQLADVPQVVGQVFVFGKQTDRAARLELVAYRTELAAAKDVVAEIAGDALGAAGDEEVAGQVSAVQHVLSWNWRLPDDTPEERRAALMSEKRPARAATLARHAAESLRRQDGPPGRRRAGRCAIACWPRFWPWNWRSSRSPAISTSTSCARSSACRRRRRSIHASCRTAELPLARLVRVDVKALSDEDLMDLYRRADHYRHIAALRKLAREALTQARASKSKSTRPKSTACWRRSSPTRPRRSSISTRPAKQPKRPRPRPPPGTWPSWRCASPAAKWPRPIA